MMAKFHNDCCRRKINLMYLETLTVRMKYLTRELHFGGTQRVVRWERQPSWKHTTLKACILWAPIKTSEKFLLMYSKCQNLFFLTVHLLLTVAKSCNYETELCTIYFPHHLQIAACAVQYSVSALQVIISVFRSYFLQ